MLADAVGFTAALISSIMFLPQAARVWRMRNEHLALQGVSASGQILLLVNAALWGLYAILTRAYWAGAPGLLNFPLAALTLFLLLRARRSSRASLATPGTQPNTPQHPNMQTETSNKQGITLPNQEQSPT